MLQTQNKDGTLALAFSSEEDFTPLSIMGVASYGKLEAFLPNAKFSI